jgi:hypothetical protein
MKIENGNININIHSLIYELLGDIGSYGDTSFDVENIKNFENHRALIFFLLEKIAKEATNASHPYKSIKDIGLKASALLIDIKEFIEDTLLEVNYE